MLQEFSNKIGIGFTASAMDETSLSFLCSLDVPFIKIGSGDFSNKPLLLKAINLNIPLVISTGMAHEEYVVKVFNLLSVIHDEFCFLHCVSSYPTAFSDTHLRVIQRYQALFPNINIGYSGHELGVDVSITAAVLGAKVIERHFTLDKSWKGSDHVCSLLPEEFKIMVEGIRAFEQGMFLNLCSEISLGNSVKQFQPCEQPCYTKLGKTIVAARDLKQGEAITAENIFIKVAEPKGIRAEEYDDVLGKLLARNVSIDESIMKSDLV